MVGEGGFEPPKLEATDLQSAPFGHSGILPYEWKQNNGAGGRTRTPDLLITNQLLYQLSYTSLYCLICRTDDIYYIISPSTCQAFFILFSFFLIKWSRRQDLNLRHLGPKPSTLPNWVTPRSWRCTRWGKVSSHGKVPSFVCLELHRCFCEAFVCVIRQLNYYTPQCPFCQ